MLCIIRSARYFWLTFLFERGRLNNLSTSTKRFPDGAQYRIEIPSVEAPVALKEALKAIDEYGVKIHRVSQGSGIMLQTDEEIKERSTFKKRSLFYEGTLEST